MIISVVPGARSTATITTEGRNVRDVEPDLQELEPSEAPLTQILTRLDYVKATNMLVEWFEDQLLPDFDTLAANLGVGDATMTVSNWQYYVYGDLVKVADNEIVRVSATPTNATVAIQRAYGNTALAANQGQRLFIVSNAGMEGDSYRPALSTQKVNKYNYCQKLETVMEWTNEDIGTETFAGMELPNEQRKAIIEQKKRMEKAFVNGMPYLDQTGALPVRTFGGMLYYIQTNVKDVSAGFTEAEFEDFMRICFRYGGRHKLLFCSPKAIQSINAFARGRLQTHCDDETYGVTITQYKSAGRNIGLIEEPLLTNSSLNDLTGIAGYAFLVDPQYLKMAYFNGDSTKLHENLQNPGQMLRVDAVRGTPSMKMMLDQTHGLLTGIQD